MTTTNAERSLDDATQCDYTTNQDLCRGAPPARARLRVGLILDSFFQPAWVKRLIQGIAESDFAELVVVIKKERVLESSNRRKTLRDQFLFKLYSRMDESEETPYQDPLEIIDLVDHLNELSVETVVPLRVGEEDFLTASDISWLMGYKLDVLIDLGETRTRGQALDLARYGIWSYEPSARFRNCQRIPGFWEVMYGEVITELNLYRFAPSGPEGTVLARCTTSTDQLSVKATRCKHYWKAAFSLERKLRQFYQTPSDFLQTCDVTPHDVEQEGQPGTLETAWRLAKVVSRRAHRSVRDKLLRERWSLAFFTDDFDPTSGAVSCPVHIEPPRDRFWADPFPMARDGKYYIFIEEYIYERQKAHISVIEMDLSGNWRMPTKVLECPYHLSYPYVFEWDGHVYMIPETKKNNCIALFRCDEFPLKWSFDRVLIENVQAVDATIHEHQGLWWLFCNIGGTYFPSNDELHVFYAETPLGPWHAHKLNPVKTDVRSARPAGKLFYKDKQLYRPSQDCSIRMGGAIAVNRVNRLTAEEFEEEEIARIDPSWKRGLYGVHTLNRANELTMLDCFGYIRKFP
jgi:hypothetical protein